MTAPSSASFLEKTIRSTQKPILLMSHLVLGFPSLEENRQVIDQMVKNGVDIMELQIPFSEPIADGPGIAMANQTALDNGFRVADGMRMIAETTARYSIPFLVMTYYNILVAYGVEAFIRAMAEASVRGLIVPDLPLDEAGDAMGWCRQYGDGNLDWIQIMTPTSSTARLQALGQAASGFVYCVARKGVTGKKTDFGQDLNTFIGRCRAATSLPLAVGFGVKTAADVNSLKGLAEIAVVGTAAIDIHKAHGASAVGSFFSELRG